MIEREAQRKNLGKIFRKEEDFVDALIKVKKRLEKISFESKVIPSSNKREPFKIFNEES